MILRIVYDGNIDDELDSKARTFAESLGFKWYAQGYNIESDERDICFDKKD